MRKFSLFRPKKTSKKHQTHPERFQTLAEPGNKAANTPSGAQRAVVPARCRKSRKIVSAIDIRRTKDRLLKKHTTNCLAEMYEQKTNVQDTTIIHLYETKSLQRARGRFGDQENSANFGLTHVSFPLSTKTWNLTAIVLRRITLEKDLT